MPWPVPYVDAHVHLWDVDAVPIPWFRTDLALPRRVVAADFERAAPEAASAVAVQAANTLQEFSWLEDECGTTRRPMRLVGQYEPSPDGWAGVLQPRLHRLAGVRLAAGSARVDLSDIPGIEELANGLSASGRILELLLRPEQLPAATALVARHPALRTVLCHLGLGFADPDPAWRRALREHAALPNTHAKISGIIRPAEGPPVVDDRLRLVVAHARECFGDDRLLFGSDWPMSARVAPHRAVVAITAEAWGADSTRAEGFWAATARRLYGF